MRVPYRPHLAYRTLVPLLAAALLLACAPTTAAPAKPAPAPEKPAASSAAPPAAAPTSAPAAASAATAAPVATQPPPRVALKLGVSGRPDQAHLQLALDRGYFTQEGLDVETVQINTGAEMVPALATNQIQVGSGALSAALFNAMNRDIGMRLVSDFAHIGPGTDTTLSFIVRKDLAGTIKSFADAKGRTLAISGPQGNIADLILARALEKSGTTLDGIEMHYLPFPDIMSALSNRVVDIGVMTEPFVTQASAQGIAEVLYPGGELIPNAHLAIVYYSPPFAQNQDAATRFMVAYLKGVRDHYDAFHLKQNREAAIDLLVKSLPIKDPRVWETYPPQYVDLNGQINMTDLRQQADFYFTNGMLPDGMPNIDQFVDPQFTAAAVQRLGRR